MLWQFPCFSTLPEILDELQIEFGEVHVDKFWVLESSMSFTQYFHESLMIGDNQIRVNNIPTEPSIISQVTATFWGADEFAFVCRTNGKHRYSIQQ